MSTRDFLMVERPDITGATAIYRNRSDDWLEEVRKKFTFTSRYDDVVKMYMDRKDGISLPRSVCPLGVEDKRVDGIAIKCTSKIKPRNADQVHFITESVKLLREGHSFIGEAPTGTGKTVMSIDIICQVGVKTLIVVPKEDLIKQWKEELIQFTDLTKEDIGFIQADKFDVAGKKVVIGMLHSLAIEGRYPAWLTNAFGLVVFDEVHRLGAETFSTVASLFNSKLRLGLSATPDRSDGKEVIFYSHIGPIRVRIKKAMLEPKVLVFNSPWRCPMRDTYDPRTGRRRIQKIPHTAGKTMHINKMLARSVERNKLITGLLVKAYNADRRIVVFSDLVDHLNTLLVMTAKAGVPGKDMSLYIGGMSDKEYEKAKVKKIIFATFGMMAEGTNIPWLDTCVLCTPRSDVKQTVGRILREYPDKKEPVVIDIRDDDSPVFYGYARKRLVLYKSLQGNVKVMR